MAKLTLTDIADLRNPDTAKTAINANSSLLETALENTLSRDGTSPNEMEAALDMNGNYILNLPEAVAPSHPVNKAQLDAAVLNTLNVSGSGIVVSNGTGIPVARTITGTSNQITVTNGNGLSGNPTLSFPTTIDLSGKTILGGTFENVGGRILLTENKIFYVRPDGNDGNDGSADTAAAAFKTWQGAYDKITNNYDFNGKTVTVKAGGTGVRTFAPASGVSVLQATNRWPGNGVLVLEGDTTTPSNVLLTSTNADCFFFDGEIGVTHIKGFKISTVTAGSAIEHRASGQVHLTGNIIFGACAEGCIKVNNDNSYLQVSSGATVTFTTSTNVPVFVDSGYLGASGTFAVTGSPTFTAFCDVNFRGFAWITNITGSWTGKNYQVRDNGMLRSQFAEASWGGSLPGTVSLDGTFEDAFNGTSKSGFDTLTSAAFNATTIAATGKITTSSAAADALTVGNLTNPVLWVDASTASQDNGWKMVGKSTTSAPGLSVSGNSANIPGLIDAKGTGSLTLNSTGTGPVILRGTSTNDNAAAGMVGEYIEATLASGSSVSLTTDVAANVISISLTPGDWDVYGQSSFTTAATTSITRLMTSISATSNTLDNTVGKLARFVTPAIVPGAEFNTQPVGPFRVSLSATTTIYLVVRGTFTVSTLTAFGFIRARRMR